MATQLLARAARLVAAGLILVAFVVAGPGARPAKASSNVCWGTIYANQIVAPYSSLLNNQPLLGPVISYDFNGDNEPDSLSFHASGNQLSGSSARVSLRNLDGVNRRAKGWFVTTVGCV
jgi:hypothetical protein